MAPRVDIQSDQAPHARGARALFCRQCRDDAAIGHACQRDDPLQIALHLAVAPAIGDGDRRKAQPAEYGTAQHQYKGGSSNQEERQFPH